MPRFVEVPPDLDAIATSVVDACWTIWSNVGPGLLETAYQMALAEELTSRGHQVQEQVPVAFSYGSRVLAQAYRLDILVDDQVIVEVKSAVENHPAFSKQLLTYLRLTNRRLGIVANLGHPHFRAGVTQSTQSLRFLAPLARLGVLARNGRQANVEGQRRVVGAYARSSRDHL